MQLQNNRVASNMTDLDSDGIDAEIAEQVKIKVNQYREEAEKRLSSFERKLNMSQETRVQLEDKNQELEKDMLKADNEIHSLLSQIGDLEKDIKFFTNNEDMDKKNIES